MHHAIAFAFASEFCRKLPFARNFRSEDEIFAISFADFHSHSRCEFLRNATFAAFFFEIWWLRFAGEIRLGASEFAFAFTAGSLRPRCTQCSTHKATRNVKKIRNITTNISTMAPLQKDLVMAITWQPCAAPANHQVVAEVWEKDVWDFQAKSGSSGSCRLFLHFLSEKSQF